MSAPFRDSRLPGAFVVTLPRRTTSSYGASGRARWSVRRAARPGSPGSSRRVSATCSPAARSAGRRRGRARGRSGPARRSSSWRRGAICLRMRARFALLYRLLWRLQRNPRIMEDRADPEVRRIDELARTVRRDIHKMRAFVRFRRVEEADGSERLVAWFEPEHNVLRANAGFFVRRFAQMRWSILTPRARCTGTAKWLTEGPPAQRGTARRANRPRNCGASTMRRSSIPRV